MRLRSAAIWGAVALLVAGCAPATRVVLLPQADQGASSVIVETSCGRTVLSQPNEEAKVFSAEDVRTAQLDEGAVNKRYGELIAAAPPPPQSYTLYFKTGTAQFTDESAAQVEGILQDAMERSGGEIIITGHTDSVGELHYNDRLSLQRAHAIREMFISRGFDPLRVIAAGRGERELLHPTADGVDEPRNRRAEIVVR